MITSEKDFDVEAFWDLVEAYRARWKLSLRDLSDMMGVDHSNLQTSFKYRRPPSFTYALRLAYICDFSIDKLSTAANNCVT